jgi:uncharacterized protein YigA (DUF484 family)
VQLETIKIVEQLIYKNDPDLELHLSLILPSMISLLDSPNDSIKDLVMLSLKVYCQITQNVEQVLQSVIRNGIENDNVRSETLTMQAHVRHQLVKEIPEFLAFGQPKHIERSPEFK